MSNGNNLYVTPCKDCCFAVYEGDTQTGCRFDRVEKFRGKGVGVREVYDRDKEFFVIETACLLHRSRKSPWAMANPGGVRMSVARGEVEVEADAVVVMGEGHSVAQARATLDSLLWQKVVQPNKVTVVVNRGGVKASDLVYLMPSHWEVKFLLERLADGSRPGTGRCVDHAVAGSTAQFYAVFSPGFSVPDDFFACLDRAVNDDLERFVMLEPNAAGEGLVVQTRTHRYYGGNTEAVIQGDEAGVEAGTRADSVVEKIRHRVRVEGKPGLVKKVSEVCPSFPS